MAKTKVIADQTGKIYALGSVVEINKIYDKLILAYPNRHLYVEDAEGIKRKDCVGAKKSVSFVPIQF